MITLDISDAVSELTGGKQASGDHPVDAVWGSLLKQESGGRQFGADGKPIRSSKGATGIAQVMRATGPEAAAMAGLPWDEQRWENDSAYNEAIGKAYLENLYGRLGSIDKALAAYNGGIGNVARAVKTAQAQGRPDAWLDFMPEETRKYVPSILGRSGAQAQSKSSDPEWINHKSPYVQSAPPVPDATVMESIEDTGRAFASGAASGVKSIVDLFGADSAASSALSGFGESIRDGYSPQKKSEIAAARERSKLADEYGSTSDQMSAAWSNFWASPLDAVAEGAGSIAPSLLAMFIPGGQASIVPRLLSMGAIGAGMGAGYAKGTIYEEVEKGLKDAGFSADDAKKVAAGAQAYDGENGGLIAANAAMGALASMTGFDKSLAKAVTKGAAKGAIKEAVEAEIAKSGLKRSVASGAAKEAMPEFAQGYLEKVTGNAGVAKVGDELGIAEMSERPWNFGATGEATAGLLASAPLGAAGGYMDYKSDPIQHVRDKGKEADSPLSRAADAGNPAPAEDPLRARIDVLKADAPTILDALRRSNNPETAKDFVDTMNQAQNPSFSPDMREAMVAQMEAYAAHAKAGVVPGMVLSKETDLSVPTVEQQPTATDGPLIDGQKALPDPNVIDVDGTIVDGPSDPPGGQTPPTSQPIQDTAQQTPMTQAAAPKVSIPADTSPDGNEPASIRKRKAQLDALAAQGFETVVKTDGGFRMVNSKTNQFFPLESPAEIAMARKAVADRINVAANKAATSPQNDLKEPSEAQKKAGNYKKGEPFDLNGFSITIENPAGSVRKGVDPDGKAWESPIVHHYGDLNGVTGLDGDKMDVFVGPSPWNQKVFVVDQVNPKTGKLDEHKVMMGFGSAQEAAQGYLANYEAGWKGLGNLTEMTLPEFQQWSKSNGVKKAAADANTGMVYSGKSFGVRNDTGANQAGNRGSDQGTAGGDQNTPRGSAAATDVPSFGSGLGDSDSQKNDRAVLSRYSANQEDVFALQASAVEGGLSVSVEAPPQDAVTGATTRFLHALEKLTGKRGIAVKVTGEGAYDGVQIGENFYVNVDNPQTSIPFTIAHEFKHMGESFPGLNKLHDRMWDRIPESAKAEYAKRVGGFKYNPANQGQVNWLKSEMVADFMGRRFNDRQWLQRLAKEKPNLFAEFVRDWVRLLDSLIGEIKSMLGVDNDRTRTKQIDTLMRNHLKQLEEMKSIAIEVAVEWAKQNPGLAKKSGVNYSTRGYDANAEQDGILSKNRINGTSGRLDQDSGRPDGQARDGRPDVLGEAGAQRLAVLQPPELRVPGGRGARDGEAGGQVGGRAGYGRSDAQAESGSRNLPEKTERRGFYGQPQEGSVEVTGIHFSQQPRDTLISDFYGTGLKGAERERLSDPKNSDIRPRIYFYVSRGKDIVRESGVGNVMHKVTLRNLYDVTADDLDIVASTRGKGLSEADKSSAWERAVMNAGFDGYVVKDPIQPQWYAVLVGKHQVQPSLDPKQVAEAAEMSKPKPKTRREGDELVATPDSAETVPLIRIKPKINEGAPSFRFQYGAARVLASEADMANAIIESEGLKFKFNTRNSLPESNAKRVTENLMSDNYKGLDGVMVEVDGKTVDAKQALEQIDRRKDALDMVLECLI